MVTVQNRIDYWKGRSDYLGYSIDASKITDAIVVDLTIYTKSGASAIERAEKWVVPNASIDTYLTATAYRRGFLLSNKMMTTVIFGRSRRWFR